MAEYRISGVWKNSNNVITHYAFHEVKKDGIDKAKKLTKSEAIELLEHRSNSAETLIWNYKKAKFERGEPVSVIDRKTGKYLKSNPDDQLTDNLNHLIDYDWVF